MKIFPSDGQMFFKQFLKHPVATGALTATSKRVSRLIAEQANLDTKRCVVELGPGTGAFTKEILTRISPETEFFCLENKLQFVNETIRNCPSVTVHHASAINIKLFLNKHGQESSDCVISGIPWAALDQESQSELLSAIYDSLDENGSFLAIAYATGFILPSGIRFKRLLNQRFRKVERTRIIWRNILPAFVYHCLK